MGGWPVKILIIKWTHPTIRRSSASLYLRNGYDLLWRKSVSFRNIIIREKINLNDSFLIKITSIRKLQLIWLTVVNQIASGSFVAKDHVWKASTAFIYSFVLSRNQCHNIYTSTPCWTSNRNWDITGSFHQYSQGLHTYKINEVRVSGDRSVWVWVWGESEDRSVWVWVWVWVWGESEDRSVWVWSKRLMGG